MATLPKNFPRGTEHHVPDANEPKPMAVHCPSCDATTIGQPRGFTVYAEPSEGPPERWTLLRCPRGHPLLVVQSDFGSAHRFDDDAPLRAYPPQERALSREIPSPLREAHDEARKSFRAKAYKAAVVMCGRTLEGACQHQGVKERNLHRSLERMRDTGLIDGRLWEWAQLLKVVRNAAAHFNDEPLTRQDAEDCLAFNEALLDYLYVLTGRFNAMRVRREPNHSSE